MNIVLDRLSNSAGGKVITVKAKWVLDFFPDKLYSGHRKKHEHDQGDCIILKFINETEREKDTVGDDKCFDVHTVREGNGGFLNALASPQNVRVTIGSEVSG